MGFPRKYHICLVSITILLGYFSHVSTAADYTNLVFKGCADQKFQDPSGIYSQNLKTLMQTLVSQSSHTTFSTATSGGGANEISGLYQCRGDVTTSQCYGCVSKIPELSDKLCGGAVAARVQLSGCYLRYEVAGFKQVPETQFLYKVCGSSSQASRRTEFESKRDTAFNMTEDGVKSGSSLFYTGDYQSVYVLGQCEGDLATNDCGDCVKTAFETAKQDCGDSFSAQVYLHKCYISYSYYPNGIPTISSGSGETRQRTQKTVAIAVGGVAALGFIVVCLMCLKSVLKRRSKKHEGY
ncbi:plasmodesmata-located protein 1-like [Hibiscus syriacus]|uniref:plasmodesmata-located protein 1-like n=1 Tax=Hibiscus syriacus TaxID=106335 RepID=UPI0019239115|nr:plasmodesmata-located protein 1-like [Hibiscus syriacus]